MPREMAMEGAFQRNQRGQEEEDVSVDAESEECESAEEGGDIAEEVISDMSDEDGDGNVEEKISRISFGALKRAHDALSRKRKRPSDSVPEQEEKLEALRKRLKQIREKKGVVETRPWKKASTTPSPIPEEGEEESASESDSDSDSSATPSEEGAPSHARSSKHAPTAQSSRHQVTRKRTVIDVPKRVVRDPRFDALSRSSSTHPTNDQAYAFLTVYQKAEIAELKTALKKSKDEDERELLRREVNRMENRLKAKASKEREREVIRKHRREERERVEQGKTPYFLKRKDVKERALVEKYKGMKGKERERLIERRRIKEGQKEKRRMPNARRMAG